MRIARLLQILWVVLRHRLDRLLPPGGPPALRGLRRVLGLLPTPGTHPAVSMRRALEELGPVFIKFGQSLATRRDLLEPEIIAELQSLTDDVPPFPAGEAVAIIEAELGAPVSELFANFEIAVLASASVAQVHAAELPDGRKVVVKVIRPGIETRIRRDTALMLLLAGAVERWSAEGRRLHPVDIVQDYEHVILDELNLNLEAGNANRLRENWLGSGKLYVPEVHFDLTRSRIMVSERIHGIPISEIEELTEHGVNMQALATAGVEIFFTQVFEQNYFHADMHPGNVFIDATDPANPSYIGLDCAIMGSLTENDKDYLARNLVAFFSRDYAEVARLHISSGWVPADTNVTQFESVIRAVCDPLFQKPISEISFGRVLVSLFQTARRFNMEVQPQLVLLQKTLLNIEGLGRQIYPGLNLWETAAPFMERWMAARGGGLMLRKLFPNAPEPLLQLSELPGLMHNALTELAGAGARHEEQIKKLDALEERLESSQKRNAGLAGVAIATALAVLWIPLEGPAVGSEVILGTSVAGGVGAWLLFRP